MNPSLPITNIVLDSNTKVRLTREGKDINVELMAGAITYKLGSMLTDSMPPGIPFSLSGPGEPRPPGAAVWAAISASG